MYRPVRYEYLTKESGEPRGNHSRKSNGSRGILFEKLVCGSRSITVHDLYVLDDATAQVVVVKAFY